MKKLVKEKKFKGVIVTVEGRGCVGVMAQIRHQMACGYSGRVLGKNREDCRFILTERSTRTRPIRPARPAPSAREQAVGQFHMLRQIFSEMPVDQAPSALWGLRLAMALVTARQKGERFTTLDVPEGDQEFGTPEIIEVLKEAGFMVEVLPCDEQHVEPRLWVQWSPSQEELLAGFQAAGVDLMKGEGEKEKSASDGMASNMDSSKLPQFSTVCQNPGGACHTCSFSGQCMVMEKVKA